MAPNFLSERGSTVTTIFTCITGTHCAKFRLFSNKVSTIKTLFPSLREMLYAGRVKLVAQEPELFTHAVVQLVVVGSWW